MEEINAAPPGIFKTLFKIMGYLPYQLVQDFFHQQSEQYYGIVKPQFVDACLLKIPLLKKSHL